MSNYLFALVLSFLCCHHVFSQGLLNGDFENRSSAPAEIPGWKTVHVDSLSGAVAGAGRAGKKQGEGYGLRLRLRNSSNRSSYATQIIALKQSDFQKYRIVGYIRTEGVNSPGARIYVYGTSGKRTAGVTNSEYFVGSTPWTKISIDYYADASIDSLTVGCLLAGTGVAYFDDVSVEPYTPTGNSTGEEAEDYLKEFFAAVMPRALDHELIDWDKLRRDGVKYIAGAQSPAEVYPALRLLLHQINEHSFFAPPYKPLPAGSGNTRSAPAYEYSSGRLVGEAVGLLHIPDVSGLVAITSSFADSLQGLIADLERRGATKWVVDLRDNTGGNCWPMLAGLGPLFKADTLGYFQQRDGSESVSWNYRDGAASMAGSAAFAVTGEPYVLKTKAPDIAVLTGPETASSGEVVTAAFRGQAGTRSFGRATAGLSTTNTSIALSDGATVYLTVSVFADRTGRQYGKAILPDEVVPDDEETLSRALSWLNREKKTSNRSPCKPALEKHLKPFNKINSPEFAFLAGIADSSRIIGLGEDTHGSSEFTRLTQEVFMYLVENHGYQVLIIEDSFGQARKLNDYINGLSDKPELWEGNWRYYTEEFRGLLEQLKLHNINNSKPVRIYGAEMQYVHEDARYLQQYLTAHGININLGNLKEFGSIWQNLEVSALMDYRIIVDRVQRAMDERAEELSKADANAYRLARQHLNVINQYLTAAQPGEAERRHDFRELYMLENIQWIMREEGESAKALFWAQNGHVHDGLVNTYADAIGHQLKKIYRDEYFAIGTDFGKGAFLAYPSNANELGWKMQVHRFGDIDPTTFTYCLDQLSTPNSFINFKSARQDDSLREYLREPLKLMSGAGAQYWDRETEYSRIGTEFDGLIYLRESTPIRRLD